MVVWPEQIIGELTVTVGNGVTLTLATTVFVQPTEIPNTVKLVVLVGDTIIVFVASPVFQI